MALVPRKKYGPRYEILSLSARASAFLSLGKNKIEMWNIYIQPLLIKNRGTHQSLNSTKTCQRKQHTLKRKEYRPLCSCLGRVPETFIAPSTRAHQALLGTDISEGKCLWFLQRTIEFDDKEA